MMMEQKPHPQRACCMTLADDLIAAQSWNCEVLIHGSLTGEPRAAPISLTVKPK